MFRLSRSVVVSVPALVFASAFLIGCSTEHHDEPWINPGQAERIAERDQRDEQLQQQLRDRGRTGQAQR